MLALFAIGAGFSRRVFDALELHFARSGDASGAEQLVRRFYLLIRIEQGMRLTVLALMVLPL